jgi:hypothetical protein
MLVDGSALGDTRACFERGNHAAAVAHQSLCARLAACGSMAGDSSFASSFASAYDSSSALAVAALADLVDAFATCGSLATASLRNHASAESASVVSGAVVFDSCVPPAHGYLTVLPRTLPSSLGGDPSFLPGWAAWILDQVEGFVWPDASVPLLRDAAAAWRSAAGSCRSLADDCEQAIRYLELSISPEVPVAVSVTSSLSASCTSLADQCLALSSACAAYADRVETHRAAILDLVHDLLRDAVIVQGIGLVLAGFTAGGTAGAAALFNAARIAAVAPRFLRLVALVREAASVCAAPVRVAGTAIGDVRRELAVFRRFRETVGVTDDLGRTMTSLRLRELVNQPHLFNPEDLRGLKPDEVRKMVADWPSRPSSRGSGRVFEDPARDGRQIRIMDPYPGNRSDPIGHGHYAVVSQNGAHPVKIPLWKNPTL